MAVVPERFANDAATTLSALIVDAVVTSISVTSATPFPSAAQFRVKIDSELLLVTAGAGTTTWTVTRGVEGTTAAAHSNGAAVTHVLTQGALERWAPDHVWQPRHNGLVVASPFPPQLVTSNGALTAGVTSLIKCFVPETVTIANWVAYLAIAGATLTYPRGGVYSSAGTLLGKTAELSTGAGGLGTSATVGLKTAAMTAEAGQSLTVVGGPDVFVWAAVLTTGTTQPSLARVASSANAAVTNLGLSAAVSLSGSSGSALAALAATITPSAITQSALFPWMAFS